eukprot:3080272-Rhodomonas_salina.1
MAGPIAKHYDQCRLNRSQQKYQQWLRKWERCLHKWEYCLRKWEHCLHKWEHCLRKWEQKGRQTCAALELHVAEQRTQP